MTYSCDHPHSNRGPMCLECHWKLDEYERHYAAVAYEAEVQGLPITIKAPARKVEQVHMFGDMEKDRTVQAL